MGEQKKSRRERAQAGEIPDTIDWTQEQREEREACDWDAVDREMTAWREAGYPSPTAMTN